MEVTADVIPLSPLKKKTLCLKVTLEPHIIPFRKCTFCRIFPMIGNCFTVHEV